MKRKKRSLKCHRRTASPYPFLHCIRFFFAQGLAKSRTVRSGTHTSGLLPGPRRRLIAALVKKDFIRACIQHGVRTSGLYSAGLSYRDCTQRDCARRDCRIGIVHGGRSAGNVDSLRGNRVRPIVLRFYSEKGRFVNYRFPANTIRYPKPTTGGRPPFDYVPFGLSPSTAITSGPIWIIHRARPRTHGRVNFELAVPVARFQLKTTTRGISLASRPSVMLGSRAHKNRRREKTCACQTFATDVVAETIRMKRWNSYDGRRSVECRWRRWRARHAGANCVRSPSIRLGANAFSTTFNRLSSGSSTAVFVRELTSDSTRSPFHPTFWLIVTAVRAIYQIPLDRTCSTFLSNRDRSSYWFPFALGPLRARARACALSARSQELKHFSRIFRSSFANSYAPNAIFVAISRR